MSQQAPFAYDPFDAEVMSDPLRFYRTLRDDYPVYRLEEYDAWAVSRFADVYDVLDDTDERYLATEGDLIPRENLLVHNQGPVADPPLDPLPIWVMLGSPVHGEVRQAMGRPLRPGAVRRLEDFVREIARARLDELLPQGRFNLTSDYGGIVSASTMCHLLGMPLDEAPTVLGVVNSSTTSTPSYGVDFGSMLQQVGDLIIEHVGRRRATRGDDDLGMVDGLLDYRIDGRALTDQEITDQLAIMLIGGTETLPKVVAHGLMELWRNADQLEQVREDLGTNCRVAFEEMLRYCAPAQWFSRTVRKPGRIGEQDVEPGQRLILLIASANRDEREFDDPDRFQWDREMSRSVFFGHGAHFCIGNHLARLEGRVLLEEFLRRAPDYDIDVEAAERPPSSFQWGWMNVPALVG